MTSSFSDEEKKIKDTALSRVMKLNAPVNGIVFGIVFGLIIFIATNWLVLKGGRVIGPNLSLLGQFFIGYQVTFLGSLVGFLYGFLTGFIFGFFIAAVYNWIVGLRERKSQSKG